MIFRMAADSTWGRFERLRHCCRYRYYFEHYFEHYFVRRRAVAPQGLRQGDEMRSPAYCLVARTSALKLAYCRKQGLADSWA